MNKRQELVARFEELRLQLGRSFDDSDRHADFLKRFGGVTLRQLGALRQLVKRGPMTMNELADQMEISPSSATQLVDRLVEHNLVEREHDTNDRRILRVAISAAASEVVTAFEKESRRKVTALLSRLNDDDLQTLVSLVEQIVESTQADPPAGVN